MASQLAKTDSSNLSSIEAPAILLLEDDPIVFWGIEKSTGYLLISAKMDLKRLV